MRISKAIRIWQWIGIAIILLIGIIGSVRAASAILVRVQGLGNGMYACEYSNGVTLVVQGTCPNFLP